MNFSWPEALLLVAFLCLIGGAFLYEENARLRQRVEALEQERLRWRSRMGLSLETAEAVEHHIKRARALLTDEARDLRKWND